MQNHEYLGQTRAGLRISIDTNGFENDFWDWSHAHSLERAIAYATELHDAPARIDYFATSLPTLLLFDDNLAKRQRVTALFLMAQAELGLGRRDEALKRIKGVLKADAGHTYASDLLEALRQSDRRAFNKTTRPKYI